MKFARILLIAILILACVTTLAIAADTKDKVTKEAKTQVTKVVKEAKVADLSTQALTILDEVHKGVKSTIGELKNGAKVAVPEVVGAVARAIFWRNLSLLVRDFIIALILITAIIYYLKRFKAFWQWGIDNTDNDTPGILAPIFATVILAIFFIAFFCDTHLLDARCWMGVFDQKAYLANMILEKIKIL